MPASADSQFSNFSSTSELALNKDATSVGNVLHVARGTDRLKYEGSAWYVQKQRRFA